MYSETPAEGTIGKETENAVVSGALIFCHTDRNCNDTHLSDSYNGEDISFTQGQILVSRAGEVVPGHTLRAWRPDRLMRGEMMQCCSETGHKPFHTDLHYCILIINHHFGFIH